MLPRVAWVAIVALVAASFSTFVVLGRSPADQPPSIDRIAVTGHGMAFDAKMRAIPLDLKTVAAMQESLRRLLAGQKLAMDADTRGFVDKTDAQIAQTKDEGDRLMLTAAVLNRQIAVADKPFQARYGWRNRYLYQAGRALLDRRTDPRYTIAPGVIAALLAGRLTVPMVPADTGYMNECRAQQVPVPPDFTTMGKKETEWVNQGELTYNILAPGGQASVWTWTDPARRGACVALPRSNGGPGSFAGIICQSATTGRACFWDNMARGSSRRIPVATETMVIRDVQDGFTLDEGPACTGCHTGNNVFLMSPDDATWSKIMRGPMEGYRPGTFTTIVEPQADSPGARRYTPIAHASWVNPPLAAGCSGSCHGAPSGSVTGLYNMLPPAQQPPMPPACRNPGNNYRNCYGTP